MRETTSEDASRARSPFVLRFQRRKDEDYEVIERFRNEQVLLQNRPRERAEKGLTRTRVRLQRSPRLSSLLLCFEREPFLLPLRFDIESRRPAGNETEPKGSEKEGGELGVEERGQKGREGEREERDKERAAAVW